MRALLSPLTPLDRAACDGVLAILPVAAANAFRALPRADQRHALRVYQILVKNGETDTDLLAASLLHDIGKYPRVGITQRTARVLLAHWPRALVWTATDGRLLPHWRGGMSRLLNHAALGADLAASWGCTPETVAIIRASHDPDAPAIVRRLQAADDAS
ncbi:MAG: HD domain-containing protein [Thermomicrobiales bacterium]